MKTAIIGGGASGMMAAFFAAKKESVTLYEKNEKLGKKLFITGKGRCNITTTLEGEEFLNNVVRNKKFLYSSIYSFPPSRTMEFFKRNNLELKVERGNRVFPKSDKSSDIIKCFEKALIKGSVDIKLNEEVLSVTKDENFIITTDKGFYTFDRVIVATGGKSYVSTGSTGKGYEIAKSFGHKVVDLKPALVPIVLNDEDLRECSGLPLKNVELVVRKKNKVFKKFFGEALITHFGISGPVVLTASCYINRIPNKDISLYLDLKPNLDFQTLDNRFLREFTNAPNKNLSNVMETLLPKNLITPFLTRSKVEGAKKPSNITVEERHRLIKTLKEFPLSFNSIYDLNAAIVTSGGVSTTEVDPSTMESKIVTGLYFTGEVVDVDALTGGFNLQIALSTGYLAGTMGEYMEI